MHITSIQYIPSSHERQHIDSYLHCHRIHSLAHAQRDEAAESYRLASMSEMDEDQIDAISDQFTLAEHALASTGKALDASEAALMNYAGRLGEMVTEHLMAIGEDAHDRADDAHTRWEESGRSGNRSDYKRRSDLPTLAEFLSSLIA